MSTAKPDDPRKAQGWLDPHYYRKGRSLCRTQKLPAGVKADDLLIGEPDGGECLRCRIEYSVQFNPRHSVPLPYLILAIDQTTTALRKFAGEPGVSETLAIADEILGMCRGLKAGAA